MLLKLPIMLCSNASEFLPIMLKLCSTNSTFFYLNDEIMSISRLSSSSSYSMKSLSHMQQFTYMYAYINLFIVYIYVALWNLNLVNTYVAI